MSLSHSKQSDVKSVTFRACALYDLPTQQAPIFNMSNNVGQKKKIHHRNRKKDGSVFRNV